MNWKSLTVVVGAALLATTAAAQQPTLTGGRSVPAAAAIRRPMFSQISWWAKYGQPLEAPPAEPGAAEVAPNAEPEVLHDHGHGFGYVYGPGSCDCRPPCTDQLWAGYSQQPWRCSHPRYKEGGFLSKCGACGHVSDCGCTTNCGCATSCGCNNGCGGHAFKPFKQWLAHWNCGNACCDTCDSCTAPIGCAAPAEHAAPPAPEAAAPVTPPVPSVDEASVLKKPLYRRVSTTSARSY